MLKSLFAVAAILVLSGGAAAQTAADPQAAPEPASGFAPKPEARGTRHMVVTANPLASEAGLAVLRDGGSAVDAAVAALAVLNVVEPQSSGFGGGGFALHWDASAQRLTAWDGRETAPLAADPYYFWIDDPETGAPRALGWREAVATGRSVGVPGLARLLGRLHAAHGRTAWRALFGAAIGHAEDGFAVSPRLAGLLERFEERLAARPGARALFFGPDGAPLAAGARLTQSDLAETFRTLAELGPGALYSGALAAEIVAAATEGDIPGALSVVDLAIYAARERPPVCIVYRARYEVCGMGPPSSGAVAVAQILGLVERAPSDASPEHAFLEASRLAYADRNVFLADDDFVSVPVRGLLDAGYLADRAALIDPAAAAPEPATPGAPPSDLDARRAAHAGLEEGGTTHLVVVDGAGDIVSLTASIETAFGSGRVAAGLLLNNQLTDFARTPVVDGAAVANAPAPLKRPRSSMSPTIVFDISDGTRRPLLAIGSPGGSRIIEYVARAIIGVLDEGLSPAEALARPHVSQRNRDAAVIEDRPDADALAEALEGLGHAVERADLTSGLHAVRIEADGTLVGAADPRREGLALGE